MPYSTVLFDLDHTLLDSDTSELEAYEDTMRSIGVEEPHRHRAAFKAINRTFWSAVERGEITPDEVRVARFERFADHLEIDADPAALAATFVAGLGAYGELYDGSLDVLDTLAPRVALGLVTNGLGDVQRTRIDRLGIADYFDTIIVSGEVGVSKPAPAIFDLAFAELGSPARDTVVMIGDSLTSDIRGAANYGIAGCWYNPGRSAAVTDVPITFEIAALGELIGIVVGDSVSLPPE